MLLFNAKHAYTCVNKIYAETRKESLNEDKKPQEVLVLRGGFTDFQAIYRVSAFNIFPNPLTDLNETRTTRCL